MAMVQSVGSILKRGGILTSVPSGGGAGAGGPKPRRGRETARFRAARALLALHCQAIDGGRAP